MWWMVGKKSGVFLIPDGARVIRTSELIELMAARPLRDVAREIGISHSQLWRFLHDEGYEQYWAKSE